MSIYGHTWDKYRIDLRESKVKDSLSNNIPQPRSYESEDVEKKNRDKEEEEAKKEIEDMNKKYHFNEPEKKEGLGGITVKEKIQQNNT